MSVRWLRRRPRLRLGAVSPRWVGVRDGSLARLPKPAYSGSCNRTAPQVGNKWNDSSTGLGQLEGRVSGRPGGAASGAVAALELLARAAPARIVPADVLVLGIHG